MRHLKACCFSGHRSERLTGPVEWIAQELGKATDKAIADGFAVFYHGGCNGISLMAAEQVLLRREAGRAIRLTAVLPYEGQANNWTEEWRERYFSVLEKCDDVITLHTKYINGCYRERDRYMLNRSSRLIAVCNGACSGGTKNTILYAERQGVEIQIIPVP